MKLFKLLSLLVILILSSCNQSEEIKKSEKQITFNNQILSIDKLSIGSEILNQLYASDAWLSLSTEIKSKIDRTKAITITTYTHTIIKSIVIELTTNATYESLVFCKSENSFFPVLAKSETFNDAKIVTVSDLKGNLYYDLKANLDNKIIDANAYKDFEIPYSDSKIKNLTTKEEKTCPEKTTNGWDCFKCAVKECSEDNLCALTCTLMAPQCTVGFMLACAFGGNAS